MMGKLKEIFGIRRDERWAALLVLVLLLVLNGLVIARYYDLFTPLRESYWGTFVKNFFISGFDPITYDVVSEWSAKYNVYRHPLLAFFMFIPYLLNQALMWLTGINCAVFIVGAMLVVSGFYSFIFLRRICQDVVGVRAFDASLLALLCFSFAYVMLSASVPDHFIMSMMLLLLALWLSGRKIVAKRPLTIWQTILLFVVTAGISLNNGVKIFLSGLFVNGKRFFRPKYLAFAVIIPAALMWLFARWEYRVYVWPQEKARNELKAKRNAEKRARDYQALADSLGSKDKGQLDSVFKIQQNKKMWAKYRADHRQPWNMHAGKPIARQHGGELVWREHTTAQGEPAGGHAAQPARHHLLRVGTELCGGGAHRADVPGGHPPGLARTVLMACHVVFRLRPAAARRTGLRYERGLHHGCPLDICHPHRHELSVCPTQRAGVAVSAHHRRPADALPVDMELVADSEIPGFLIER